MKTEYRDSRGNLVCEVHEGPTGLAKITHKDGWGRLLHYRTAHALARVYLALAR